MITIQKITQPNADTLLRFSRDTFYEFFGPVNEPANMELYSAVAFTQEKIASELANPDAEFYFALLDGQVVGYLKLNFNEAQTEFCDKSAVEIERIYVSGAYHGKKIGQQFLNLVMEIAVERSLNYIWLGVWEHNYKAIGFYEHHGFTIFSSHDFLLGKDLQRDLLMKKAL